VKVKKEYPLEEEEQENFILYLEKLISEGKNIKYSSIPNSTFTKSWKQKRKNKTQGLRAGLPDLFLIVNNRPFFIEMKRINGKLSDCQKEWINAINECEKLKAVVCYGCEEAKNIVESCLNK
jgi:hypothetical protein